MSRVRVQSPRTSDPPSLAASRSGLGSQRGGSGSGSGSGSTTPAAAPIGGGSGGAAPQGLRGRDSAASMLGDEYFGGSVALLEGDVAGNFLAPSHFYRGFSYMMRHQDIPVCAEMRSRLFPALALALEAVLHRVFNEQLEREARVAAQRGTLPTSGAAPGPASFRQRPSYPSQPLRATLDPVRLLALELKNQSARSKRPQPQGQVGTAEVAAEPNVSPAVSAAPAAAPDSCTVDADRRKSHEDGEDGEHSESSEGSFSTAAATTPPPSSRLRAAPRATITASV